MEKKGAAAGAASADLKEAEKLLKKGDAALKTGLFKWSPNHLEASMHYEKAAKAFKQHGARDQAIEAFLKWSAACDSQNENWGAAEGLVEAAFLERNRQKSLEFLKRA